MKRAARQKKKNNKWASGSTDRANAEAHFAFLLLLISVHFATEIECFKDILIMRWKWVFLWIYNDYLNKSLTTTHYF